MKSLQRWILVGTLLVLSAFAIHGCGGDDKKNPVNPPGGGGQGTPDVLITITGQNGSNSYSPNPANVTSGQLVAWRNSDPIVSMVHTATQNGGGFNTGDLANGEQSDTIRITTVGNLNYICNRHPGTMSGTLQVTQ